MEKYWKQGKNFETEIEKIKEKVFIKSLNKVNLPEGKFLGILEKRNSFFTEVLKKDSDRGSKNFDKYTISEKGIDIKFGWEDSFIATRKFRKFLYVFSGYAFISPVLMAEIFEILRARGCSDYLEEGHRGICKATVEKLKGKLDNSEVEVEKALGYLKALGNDFGEAYKDINKIMKTTCESKEYKNLSLQKKEDLIKPIKDLLGFYESIEEKLAETVQELKDIKGTVKECR